MLEALAATSHIESRSEKQSEPAHNCIGSVAASPLVPVQDGMRSSSKSPRHVVQRQQIHLQANETSVHIHRLHELHGKMRHM